MDLHIVPGVKAKDVAQAHQLDLALEEEYQCKCMTYWIDESRGHIFCLIDAPSRSVVEELHSKAHGLIPNRVIEVETALVESFLGRITDPEEATMTEDGLKLINDSSFRFLLTIKMNDHALVSHQLGSSDANLLFRRHQDIIREELQAYGGAEANCESHECIASFISGSKALNCAIAIHNRIPPEELAAMGTRMVLNGGEPVTKNDSLFGDTIQAARRLCFIAPHSRIFITALVKELLMKEKMPDTQSAIQFLSQQDENLLTLLFNSLEEHWQDSDFSIEKYGQSIAMSTSQLYRKTIALCGLSPNALLKEFRLEKARQLMKKQQLNVSEATFESGFTSPSYFTKCFKKKYGLLPMAYLDLIA